MKCAETIAKKLCQKHKVFIMACDCLGHEDVCMCSIILV